MALQVHESVGHPTELDRVLRHRGRLRGHELPHAGRPRLAALRLRAHEHHRRPDDARRRSARFGFDDEGVPAGARSRSSREGVLVGFLTSRETAAQLGSGAGGSMRADGWSRMPLVRMTNLHLEPGEGSLDELIADVDDGLYLETNKSWSIDDKRLNFQFGTQIAWEIKDGKLGRMLRDATYTGHHAASSGARSTRSPGPRQWRAARADELRQGPARASTRTSRTAPHRRASATSRSAFKRVSAALELAERALQRREGDEAEALVQTRALRARPLRRLGGAPADADRERRRQAPGRPRRPRRRRGHEPDRRRGSARARRARAPRRRTTRRPTRTSPGSRRRPSLPRGRGLRRGDRRPRAGRAGAARGRGDRRLRRHAGLRLLHERRHGARRRLDARARGRRSE